MQIKVTAFIPTDPEFMSGDKVRQIVESMAPFTKSWRQTLIVYFIDDGSEIAAKDISRRLEKATLPSHGDYGMTEEFCCDPHRAETKRKIEVQARKYNAKQVYVLAPKAFIDKFANYYTKEVLKKFSRKEKPATDFYIPGGSTYVLRVHVFGHRLHGFTLDYPDA